MKYLPNSDILCLEYSEFVSDDPAKPLMMNKSAYDQAKLRGSITVHGRGGNGNQVLIEFETLPLKYKELVKGKYGNPYKYFSSQPLLAMLKEDMQARIFYETYLLPCGDPLPLKYQTRYARQCDWLNMISTVIADKSELKEVLKITISEFWDIVIALHSTDKVCNPELPTTTKRLREKIAFYKETGYEGLIEKWRFNNDYGRKVDQSIERLIMSLYARHAKPYATIVCRDYNEFMAGRLHMVDLETGAIFDPKNYYVDGKPYEVTQAVVKYYIEKPINRAVVDKIRMSALQFSSTHRPYHQRKAPVYSLSKITMDDISLPFKMHNGDRPWSYQIFDVASQAVIGVAFAKDKTQELVKEALRDMLRTVAAKGWGMPAEIEVEQHLNSDMKGGVNDAGVFEADILTQGAIFPFVRFCAARNPQEKRAEGFIRLKKYQQQKNRKGFQHRPFARLEANRLNDDLKTVTYTYEEIIGNEMKDIAAHNNELHPNQELYPGLTRWQVLEQSINPTLRAANLQLILPYIGHRTKTSINRGFVQVQNKKYMLADISRFEQLTDRTIIAYYLKDSNGDIEHLYLYDKHEEPICEGLPFGQFNEAKAEQTEEDMRILGKQKKYINDWERMVNSKAASLVKVDTVEVEAAEEAVNTANNADAQPVDTEGVDQKSSDTQGGYGHNNAIENPWFLDPEAAKRRATKGI